MKFLSCDRALVHKNPTGITLSEKALGDWLILVFFYPQKPKLLILSLSQHGIAGYCHRREHEKSKLRLKRHFRARNTSEEIKYWLESY